MFLNYLGRLFLGVVLFGSLWFAFSMMSSLVNFIGSEIIWPASPMAYFTLSTIVVLLFVFLAYKAFSRGRMFSAAFHQFIALSVLVAAFGEAIPYGIYVISLGVVNIYVLALILWGVLKILRED